MSPYIITESWPATGEEIQKTRSNMIDAYNAAQ